jgi:hypothetical protein
MTQVDLKTQWLEQFRLDPEDLDIQMGNGTMQKPNEYIVARIDPDTYLEWFQVGGFSIDRMLELEDAEIDIKLLGTMITTAGNGYPRTIANAYCNNDLTLERVRAILGYLR